MKKIMSIFGVILFTSVILTSCGESKKEGSEDTKSEVSDSNSGSDKWTELASKAGISPEDVAKAIEIGTKMGDCYKLESKPGAMDSEMTEECDPLMREYEGYCKEKFGTDEYSGDNPNSKKVEAFREIMFDTRNEAAKAKQK
jgi:hypothetical protein